MGWSINGNYVASCSCAVICPCPVDGRPNDPNGECRGVALFHIASGNSDGLDLSGVDFAFVNFFPSNITAGNWKVGVVADESASDEQVEALGKILSGEVGGPFAEFTPLIGENLGVERAKIAVSGDAGSVSGGSDFTFEPFTGPDGSPTSVSGAMFAFAPTYEIGRTSGHSDVLGISFDGDYGERANFEYSSEVTEGHARA